MTPWLILATLAIVLALALWLGRRLGDALVAEAREDARWDALGALIREGRARRERAITLGMTDAEARHALALDLLRRQALGGRQDSEAA